VVGAGVGEPTTPPPPAAAPSSRITAPGDESRNGLVLCGDITVGTSEDLNVSDATAWDDGVRDGPTVRVGLVVGCAVTVGIGLAVGSSDGWLEWEGAWEGFNVGDPDGAVDMVGLDEGITDQVGR
jgi:hypothetical protein